MDSIAELELGRFQPKTIAPLIYTLSTFVDPECNAHLNQQDLKQANYNALYKPNVLDNNNYEGRCHNANVTPSAFRNTKIINPSEDDELAKNVEQWESFKFVSESHTLCLVKGFNCMGEWEAIQGSDQCQVPGEFSGLGYYLSYFIIPTHKSFTCGDLIYRTG